MAFPWDFSSILQEFAASGGVSVIRRAAGTNDEGMYRPGATTTLTLEPAVIHTASGRDMERLPEGQRTKEAIVILTPEALRIGTPGGVMADRISHAGALWEVTHVEDWLSHAGYFRAIATKIEAEPTVPA